MIADYIFSSAKHLGSGLARECALFKYALRGQARSYENQRFLAFIFRVFRGLPPLTLVEFA